MKLLKENIKVISAESVAMDINNWNPIHNNYALKVTDKNFDYPKSLMTAALERFNEEAEEYCIDASKFPFIRITEDDPTYQVDFHKDNDPTGTHFSIHEIYFNAAKRQIMQACFSKG